MDDAKISSHRYRLNSNRPFTLLLTLILLAVTAPLAAYGQSAPAKPADSASDDDEGKAPALSMTASPEERTAQAWARRHRHLRNALTPLVEERVSPAELSQDDDGDDGYRW